MAAGWLTDYLALSPWIMDRYRQQMLLPELGPDGQDRLAGASVLVVGAGGLGSPASLYLAAAGIGRLVLVDPDTVALSNLHRQILFREGDVGMLKVEKASRSLHEFRSDLRLEAHACWLSDENADSLISSVDVVLDCTDNFPTRYLLNRMCMNLCIPLVYASVAAWEGQITSFAFDTDGPCLECLYPMVEDGALNCNALGTIGVVPGILGLWQANEAIHILLGQSRLTGRLLHIDLLHHEMREFQYNVAPDCRCRLPANRRHEPDLHQAVRLLTPAEFLASCAVEAGQRQTFSDAARGSYHVVDVRPASEAPGLEGALHVPLEEIAARWTECVSDRPTVFVCQAGVRSLTAAQLLAEKGKTAFSLVGGLSALNELQRGRS